MESGVSKPIAVVAWLSPQKDLKRGPNGEAIWVHLSDGRWDVSVIEWDLSLLPEGLPHKVETTNVGGIEFLFGKSHVIPPLDECTIDVVNEKLVVRKNDI